MEVRVREKDLEGAVDDLTVRLNELQKENVLFRELLFQVGQRLNGWSTKPKSLDLYCALPLGMDVWMSTQERERTSLEAQVLSLRAASARATDKHKRYMRVTRKKVRQLRKRMGM